MRGKRINVFLTSFLTVVFVFLFSVIVYASSQTEGFEYIINDDNRATLTKYIGIEKKVVVPAEIDGHKVFATEGTFYENDFVEEVVISDGIEEIGPDTFSCCKNLRTVKIADTVSSLGRYAFRESAIEKIKLPESVRNIGTACFLGCVDLAYVKTNAEKLKIAPYAFGGSGIKVLQTRDFTDVQLGYCAIPNDCTITHNFIFAFLKTHNTLWTVLKQVNSELYWIRFISVSSVLILILFIVTGIARGIGLIISGKEELKYNKYFSAASKTLMRLNDGNYSYLKYSTVGNLKLKKSIKEVFITVAVSAVVFFAAFSGMLPFCSKIMHKIQEMHFYYYLITLFSLYIATIIALIALLYLTMKAVIAIQDAILAKIPNRNARIRKIKRTGRKLR